MSGGMGGLTGAIRLLDPISRIPMNLAVIE